MVTSFFRSLLLAAGTVMFLQTSHSAAQDPSLPSIEEIYSAWKKRESRIPTGRIAWSQSESYIAGVLPFTGKRAKGDTRIRDNPATDDIHSRREYVVDGRKGRYHWEGQHWNEVAGAFEEESLTIAFNGKERRRMRDHGSTRDFGTFELNAPGLNDELDLYVIPAIMAFRPTSIEFGAPPLVEFTVLPQVEEIGQTPCVLLSRRLGTQLVSNTDIIEERLWLELAPDHLLKKRAVVVDGRPKRQIVIEYDQSAERFPASWTATQFLESGKPFEHTVAEVREVEVGKNIPTDIFEVAFIPGAQVNQLDARRMFVVRKNGSLRSITPRELNASGLTWKELAETASPEEIANQRIWMQRILFGSLLAFAIGGSGWWFLFRGFSEKLFSARRADCK